MRRSPSLVILFLLLFAAAYGSYRALDEGWHRLTSFTSGHARASRPTSGPPKLAERVVLVLVEGLRPEDARRMPAVDWLLREGSGYQLTVPEPGYPLAAAVTALTGAPPQIHGVLVAPPGQALQADNLPAAATRAGLTTGGVGGTELGAILGDTVQTWYPAISAQALVDGARSLLSGQGPDLVIIHITDLARSAAPQGQVRDRLLAEVDARLVQMLEELDLQKTAVLVSGTVPTGWGGRHQPGAPVPLVLAGAGVRSGVRGTGSLEDLAPTAAALLGAPTPVQVRGEPLLEALQAEGRPADVIAERYLASRKAFADAVLAALGAGETAPDPPTTAGEMASYLHKLEARMRRAQFTHWKASLLQRLPYVAAVLVALLAYIVVVWRQSYGGAAFLGTLSYAALFHAGFYLNGGGYTGAMHGLGADGWSALLRPGVVTAATISLAALLHGYLLSRRGPRRGQYLTAAAIHWLLSTMALIALPVTAALLFTGWDFAVQLPPIGLSIWFLVTALQALVIGAGSPFWALISVTAGRTAARLWPRREVGDPEQNASKVVRLRALRRAGRTETP